MGVGEMKRTVVIEVIIRVTPSQTFEEIVAGKPTRGILEKRVDSWIMQEDMKISREFPLNSKIGCICLIEDAINEISIWYTKEGKRRYIVARCASYQPVS